MYGIYHTVRITINARLQKAAWLILFNEHPMKGAYLLVCIVFVEAIAALIATVMLLSGIIGLFDNLLMLAVAILIIGLVVGIGCIVAVQKSTIREYSKFPTMKPLAEG